ncbi:MAG: putative tRNA/rRNA methyltransferase [Rhodospirillales bacterium]|nr:putative tRNA/rRNA methyltransferase [Rhodospirillales bacterium]
MTTASTAPVVVLVTPQLGENIGACARAMLNCGLTELRLVAPRDGWPNERAVAASSGAGAVLDAAQLYPTTEAAIADLNFVLATTARPRDMVKEVVTPEEAATRLHARAAQGQRCGVLFGAERMGLLNDDIPRADAILNIPVNPDFSSLNLAQAVLLVGYAWRRAGIEVPSAVLETGGVLPATKIEVENLFRHLDQALAAGGFYTSEQQRPSMTRNLYNLIQRAGMTEQEVRTFHGVIVALTGRSRTVRPS